MNIEKYKIIGQRLTLEELVEKVSKIKNIQDSDDTQYEVKGLIADALWLYDATDEVFGARFINLPKLYRHYSIIADNMDSESPILHIRDLNELGMKILVKAGVLKSTQ